MFNIHYYSNCHICLKNEPKSYKSIKIFKNTVPFLINTFYKNYYNKTVFLTSEVILFMICRRRRLCKYSPAGTNFYKVLQEGKSCYKIVGAFSMVPHRASGHETIWTAEFNNVPPIIIPIGALIYRYNKTDDSWVKTRHVKAPPKNFFTSPLRRSKRLKRPEDKKH